MTRHRRAGGRLRRALVVAVLSLAACDDPGANFEQMVEQPRYDPYEVGPEFPDDRVLQHPPEGTVPRDRIVDDPLLTRGEVGGERARAVPLPITRELLALGRRSYGIYCAACHGAGGYGGSVVAMNMQPPLPTPLVTGHGADHSPGYYFQVITNGNGRMPPYAAELSLVERWAVVAYLTEVLQRPHPLSPDERADSLRAERLRQRFPEAGAHGGHEHEGGGHERGGGEPSDEHGEETGGATDGGGRGHGGSATHDH